MALSGAVLSLVAAANRGGGRQRWRFVVADSAFVGDAAKACIVGPRARVREPRRKRAEQTSLGAAKEKGWVVPEERCREKG